MSNIFYTLGVVLAIVILLLLLRGVFIRRARAAYLDAESQRVVVVTGGGWNDGGIGGIGGRSYVSPTRPQPAATPGRQRGGDLDPDVVEQLPKYEAAPPGYDTIFKDDAPPMVAQELSDMGGSSSAAAARNGDVVIDMEPTSPPPPHAFTPAEGYVPPEPSSPPPPPGPSSPPPGPSLSQTQQSQPPPV